MRERKDGRYSRKQKVTDKHARIKRSREAFSGKKTGTDFGPVGKTESAQRSFGLQQDL